METYDEHVLLAIDDDGGYLLVEEQQDGGEDTWQGRQGDDPPIGKRGGVDHPTPVNSTDTL